MDKQISKPVPGEDSYDVDAKRDLKPEQPITDKDSGKGTASSGKSSGSVSQASDSTSGVELKNDEAEEQPLIPDSPMNLQPPSSGATAGLPQNNSPKKSPVRKVQEGLSWVKKRISPKKKMSSCNLESSGNLKAGSLPKKCSRNSPRNSPQNSPKKSPQKISKKPSFRQKFKSPSKKLVPADESKPILEGDELRRYSSSDEDQTGVKDQGSQQGAIPKTRGFKKSTDQSPKTIDEKSAVSKKKDRKSSEKAIKEERQKVKDKVNKSIAKKIPPAKTAALNDFENFQRFPKAPRPEDGTWSYPRCTTDEGTTTGTPSEVDLSSMSSFKIDEFSDQSLSRASPAVEQIEGGLGVLNNVPEAAVEHSTNSVAEQLAKNLNLSDAGISSGGGSAAAQVDDIAGSSVGPVPESDSGRQAELGNGGHRNPSNSQHTSYKRSPKLKEMKSQRKKDEEDDSDENS